MEFVSANGIVMSVDASLMTDRSTVVFSNSLAADMGMWARVAAELSKQFGVVRFDARGHGGSQATEGDYSLELLGRDVLALLDQLKLEKVHFVGLSLGGMVGQWLAVNAPERLKTLTLCATFHKSDPTMWEQRINTVRAQGISSIVEATLQRWLTDSFRSSRPGEVAVVREMILRTAASGYVGSAAAIRDMNIESYPGRISLPTLVLAAEKDPSAPPSCMREMQQHIVGSEFVEIEDAAHVFTFEQPVRTASVIGDFLRRHEGEGAS